METDYKNLTYQDVDILINLGYFEEDLAKIDKAIDEIKYSLETQYGESIKELSAEDVINMIDTDEFLADVAKCAFDEDVYRQIKENEYICYNGLIARDDEPEDNIIDVSELPQMEIYEMIQTGRNVDKQNKEENIEETIKAIKCDYPNIDESVLSEYVKLKADEIYAGEYDESKKIEEAKENQNLAETFKNYKAFVSNFGELNIIKDPYDKQYKVYPLGKTASDEYIYYADNKDNIEGWLYGAVMANNGIFNQLKSTK